jgi:hypothetical protein
VKRRYGFSVDEEGGPQAHTSLESAQRLIDLAALKRDVGQHPDASQYEHAPATRCENLLGVSPSGIRRALHRLGMT